MRLEFNQNYWKSWEYYNAWRIDDIIEMKSQSMKTMEKRIELKIVET